MNASPDLWFDPYGEWEREQDQAALCSRLQAGQEAFQAAERKAYARRPKWEAAHEARREQARQARAGLLAPKDPLSLELASIWSKSRLKRHADQAQREINLVVERLKAGKETSPRNR